MSNDKCTICRRVGTKLFLKGARCGTQKCEMVKRPYNPGPKPKKVKRNISEYAKELKEKQKLRNWYNLRERQFQKYVRAALAKRGQIEDAGVLLIKKLESRFDNVIFRMGFAASRDQGRQLVLHGHFLVNGKRVNIPSFEIKKGSVISLDQASKKKGYFQNIGGILKKYKFPDWIEFNQEKLEGKIVKDPNLSETVPPADLLTIFEFYSR